MISTLLLLFCAIVNVLSGPAINLLKCKVGDDVCFINNMKTAFPLILAPNPEIGALEMDPMFQKEITGDLDVLKFKMQDSTVIGFRKCEVQNAKLNKDTAQVTLLCPGFKLNGKYELKGNILGMAVEGNGDYEIITKEYSVDVELDMETITKNGKNYRHVKSFRVDAKPLGDVTYDLKNLYNGRKDLADTFLKFANENSKEMAVLVQGPVFDENFKRIMENANKYLKTVSVEEYISQ